MSLGEFKVKHRTKALCGVLPLDGAGSMLTSTGHCRLLGALGGNERGDRLHEMAQLKKAGTAESGDEAGQEQLNN